MGTRRGRRWWVAQYYTSTIQQENQYKTPVSSRLYQTLKEERKERRKKT